MVQRPPYVMYVVQADQKTRVHELRRTFHAEVARLDLQNLRVQVRTSVPTNHHSDRVAVCFYLASLRGAASARCQQDLARALAAGIPTFPVLLDKTSFTQVVPPGLHRFNALHWKRPGGALKVVNQALRSLGLTEQQRRVFVSYRHDEALAMAEQLWSVLSQIGFEVFLDRFSVEPGADFQERLFHALDDKSFVLFVESPTAIDRPWVVEELNYARKRNMGILALTWPQTSAERRRLSGLYARYRLRVKASQLRSSGSQATLTMGGLNQLVEEVEARHAAAFLRRRRELVGSITAALEDARIKYVGLSDWSLVARTKGRNGRPSDHVISVTPRSPEVPDLFALDSTRKNDEGVLVHTLRSFPDERRRLLDWATAGRNLQLVPEDEIVAFVDSL